ncbi:MAG: hypothetical protein ABIB43_03880 [archaeon]
MKTINQAKLQLATGLLFAGLYSGSGYLMDNRDKNYRENNPVVQSVYDLSKEKKENDYSINKLLKENDAQNYATLDSLANVNTDLVSKIYSLKSTPEYRNDFKKNERIVNNNLKHTDYLLLTCLVFPMFIFLGSAWMNYQFARVERREKKK